VTRPLIAALTVLALVACALIACGGGSAGAPAASATTATAASATVAPVVFSRTKLGYPGGTLQVEIAAPGAQGERGLGYRDELAADAGMIFDLGGIRVQDFWMKGMRFALDIIWIGEDKRVTEIKAGVPPQPGAGDAELIRYAPAGPARYVLEVNAGAAARLDIAVGTQLAFDVAH
jgi:uncharacterized membrane protein (UPF0127 family)